MDNAFNTLKKIVLILLLVYFIAFLVETDFFFNLFKYLYKI